MRLQKLTCLLFVLAVLLAATGCGSKRDAISPSLDASERGVASYYADEFHGRETASGETYNMNAMTAAHPSLPFGTIVRVTNLDNDRRVELRINDRGPFAKDRIIDVSYKAAKQLDFVRQGLANVEVVVLKLPG